MISTPLPVALIGLRGINDAFYGPALVRSTDAHIVAGIDPSNEARAAFAEKNPSVPLYAHLDDALAAHAIQAVIIGTPNPIHLTNIRQAAAAKLHMLVTKPLCNTVAEVRQAIALARDAGVILQSGNEFRFRPGIARAIALARQGQAGHITLATGHMGHAGGIQENFTGAGRWRSDPANCPGGCANLLGIHYIDILLAILGLPRQVQATLRHFQAHAPIEDAAAITLIYDHALAVCTSSYASSWREELVVYGTKANLVAHEKYAAIEVGAQRQILSDLPDRRSSDVLIEQLVAAIRHGQPVPTGGHIALAGIAVLEAALISSREHRPVDLGDLLSPDEVQTISERLTRN